MEVSYRWAVPGDLDFLVESRLDFLSLTQKDDAYAMIRENLYRYFEQGFRDAQFDIILAEDGGTIVGTGIVFYYRCVPSTQNPWGETAYITSVFVDGQHRRCGIATGILDRLIEVAKAKGCHFFRLQETEMGRPVYERYGFCEGKAGMILNV